MSHHPYNKIRPEAHWIRGVAEAAPELLDPVVSFKFRIAGESRVAAAGSCFAQHLSRYLPAAGITPYVAEPGHPSLSAATRQAFGYGLYSARYGNIYTTRHLLQLFDRAFGAFVPCEPVWQTAAGRFVDPYRPAAHPGGFASAEDLIVDRGEHLAAVRQMFERLDALIFTLGLTEYWFSAEDGAVFPICPGVQGGVFDPARHLFGNTPPTAVTLRADDGPALPMQLVAGHPGLFQGVLERRAARVAVQAHDASGRSDEDIVEPAPAGHVMLRRTVDGSDKESIEAWPEKGIVGGQLGPNRKGCKW